MIMCPVLFIGVNRADKNYYHGTYIQMEDIDNK